MGLFGHSRGGKAESDVAMQAPVQAQWLLLDQPAAPSERAARPRTGRTEVYSVRARETLKGEILQQQAELQLERQRSNAKARKVTEGEVVELMLEALKAARRDGSARGHAVPIADDVWHGVHEIAQRLQQTPAQVIEELVVQKIAELDLLPRK